MCWDAITAISTAFAAVFAGVTATATSVAAIFAGYVVIQGRRKLGLSARIKAEKKFMRPRFLQLRAWVYGQLHELRANLAGLPENADKTDRTVYWPLLEEIVSKWSAIEAEKAREACRRMEDFVRMASYWEKQGKVLETWDDPIGKLWLVLEPFVESERTLVGWPTKWHDFELYGKAALIRLRAQKRHPLEQTRRAT